MNNATRILIVEDQLNDYELAQREIQKAIPNCRFERVEKEAEFLKALKDFQPDVILSDYKLPQFDGMKVLQLVQQHRSSAPVIIWTGAMSEDVAVECMKHGASNYVLKENLMRLGPVVIHALKEGEAIFERKQAEEKYQSIFENSPVGIFQSTPQGRFININAAMARIYGYASPKEMIKAITDIAGQIYIETQDREQFTQLLRTNKSVENFESENIRKDGSRFWTSTSARAVHDEAGSILYYEGFLQDITDRKLAEAKLWESEARYHGIFENAQDAILVETFEGDILEVNPRACEIYGYTRDEFLQKKVIDIVPSREYIVNLPEAHLVPGQAIETVNVRANGEFFHVELSGSLYKLGNRRLLLIILRDITERKNAEQELRESQIEYQNLVETSHDLIWSMDADGRITFINRAAKDIYGYEPEELLGRSFFELLDPEANFGPKNFEDMVGSANEYHGVESRVRHKDGRQFILSANSIVLRDEHGNITGATGTSRDITRRKQAEEALREERNLLRTLIDNLPDRIYAMDRQGRKTLSNSADWKASGRRTVEEVVGKTDFDLYPPELAEPFWEANRTVLDSGQPLINFEEPGLDAEGQRVSILTTKIPLRDETGNVIGLVGVGRDITERKQAEARIKDLLSLNEKMLNYSPLGILTYKLSGECVFANQNAATIIGATVENLLLQNFHSIEAWKKSGLYALVEKAISTKAVVTDDLHHISTYGKDAWLTVHCVTFTSNNEEHVLLSILDITERKQAEEKLLQSQQELKEAQRVAKIGSWSFDPLKDKVHWSDELYRIFDVEPGNFAHTYESFLEFVQPEDRSRVKQKNDDLLKRGTTFETEYRIITSVGETKTISEIGYAVTAEDGQVVIIFGTAQDITERKRAETAEREQRILAETLRDTSEILSSSLDYGEVLDHILAAVGQVVPHDAATIMLIEDGYARVVRSKGYEQHSADYDVMDVRLPLANTNNLRTMLDTKQPVVVSDTYSYTGWKRLESTDWLRSNVGAPILIDGQVIGFVLLNSQISGFFNSAHAERLEAFANQAAVAIHNAHLLQQAQNEIAERKRAEMALQQSQARYYDIFDNSPISLWEEDYSLVKERIERLQQSGITDLNEYLSAHPNIVIEFASLVKVVDVNRASLQLYHAGKKEDLLGNLLDFASQETMLHLQDEVLGLMSPDARFSWEGMDKTLDRQELIVMVNGSIAPGYEQNWSKVIVSIHDVTERKRAEEEIDRRAKETYALLETSLALTNLDLKAILQTVGNSAKALFAADGCRVFLMQPDGETLRCVLAIQESATAFSDLKIKLGEGVTGAVAASGKAEIINNMLNDPRAVQVPGTDEEEEAIMFAPLKERDHTVGVLSIRRAGAERPFQPADLELLEAFASMAASAVSNARLFEEAQQRLDELEAIYENGLAVSQLLEPREIGNRIIETFTHYLSWHHVTIRLLRPDTDQLEVIAFNLPGLNENHKREMEDHFNQMIGKVGQGLSGWVVETGTPLRTGNVHANPQYVNTQAGIRSGLYMPLKVGDRAIGVISVESETPDAFTEQDERLLATLASQVAVAFENARLYQAAHQELLERTRAQAALWASETHYRELADSITDILFELDYNLTYTHWNKASEMFSGVPAEDAIGKAVQEVWETTAEQLEREKIYEGVLRERQAKSFETVVFPRGQKRVLEIHAYPSTRGVSVVARDITERKLDETLIQKRVELMEYSAHHSLEELMQRTVDEVSKLTDSHIGFLTFIEEDQKTLGLRAWSTETLQAVGTIEDKDLHHSLDAAGVWADALRQQRSIIHNDYQVLPNKKGLPEYHPNLIRELFIPIVRDDKVAAVLGIGNKSEAYTQREVDIAERFADYAWDIIERRQMEAALAEERNQLAKRVEQRTADLSRANSNLARALRVKDEFLANMSHELRTPLNAILGLSESLSEQVAGPLNEKQQKYLNTINESGHHLLSLINDILDLAKIEAGQITLDINKVDINSVCQASLRMIKQLAQKKNQEVLFEIDRNLGLMWADERRLKQMIVNLLSNAVKFTPESGKLGLEVHGDPLGNRILITVWDKGIGISGEDMDRLFKPFVQLDSGLAREATGTGLGLALVAQMARLHGGSVNLESQLGEGSRFTIMLPWEPALAVDASTRLRNTGKFQAIDPNETNKPTILIIEDTREVIMMLVDYLEMSGFKLVTAQDGTDGIQQAKLAHPNLILMDIMMPGMDGFETTRKLRLDSQFKDTPIIALTALAMPSDRQRCLDAGMDEYISKPVNLKALVKLIRSILLEKEEPKPK